MTRARATRFKLCGSPDIDLGRLSDAEKEPLIHQLLPLVGQLEAALARIAEIEQRLAKYEKPPKTPHKPNGLKF